jgi:YesN/AraC family two-component response regulator
LDSKLIESYTENSIVTEVNNQENPSKKQSISIELEATLLQKLYRFEQGNKFINPNISLASLAGALGTNTQYLSELINKQKNKNFNTYINELRINFIIKRILEDRKLANYKIAALAEEAGFSSHSLFSKVFKQVTNMSPSEFIHEHQKSNS